MTDHPFFGMQKEKQASVLEEMKNIRQGRYFLALTKEGQNGY
jgi:hypothetical protein